MISRLSNFRVVAALVLSLTFGVTAAESQRPDAGPTVAALRHPAELYDPVAQPGAEVKAGHARFTVLTPQLIRMEWAADGRFENHPSLVFLNRNLPMPKFTTSVTKSGTQDFLTLKTRELKLVYAYNEFGSEKFTAENLHVEFELNGQTVTWHPGLEDTENLQGTTRTLDGALGGKTKEPMGPGLISRAGWALVDDSTRPLFDSDDFRFTAGEKSPWPWVMERPAGDRQDWYFFGYGHDYKQALGDFIKVAGPIPLPPRFAFGAWWSRYWAYSDQELDELVRGFQQNSTPLDVLVIDMDWHRTYGQMFWNRRDDASGHELGWSGYSWNKLLFPEPQKFLAHIHDEGLKVTLNLHPASGVQPFEDPYAAMARAMGMDPAAKQYVPFDITNKNFARNYFDILHHPLEKQGIDFWWLDWQQEPNTRTAGVSPTWWLNYTHFSDQEREGKRPLLFHRWGGLGNHRYQIGFSGDTISVWDSLAFQPWFTATAANVGYAYWSHDIGGHMPGVVDPELYTRWIQFGIFSPILRTHTTKNADSERRAWAYPEPYSGIMRAAFQRRYAMLPYVYTEARRTYDTGVAFLHPLYYDWPEQDAAYTSKGEYLFGDGLLVAPIVKPADADTDLAHESVWLPPGEWYCWPTGRHLSGPSTTEVSASIDQTPVYVRSGTILPMAPPMETSNAKPLDPLILTVFPLKDGERGSYTLYEDAGDTRAYENNQDMRTPILAEQLGAATEMTIHPAQGSYPGMVLRRGYELRLPGDWPPNQVTVNGRALSYEAKAGVPGWRYEGNTLTTIVTLPSTSVRTEKRVVITREAALIARRTELNGFPGAMTRLREAFDVMQQTWPLRVPPDTLIDAMQSGDRIGYTPAEAGSELRHFAEVLPQAIAAVHADAKGLPPEEEKAIEERRQRLKGEEAAQAEKMLVDYKTRGLKAAALVDDIHVGGH
ncbi:MAG TPA: TIM-barrel domain-containing protein [Acidobacteriaceae bacterium]|nr:TIM-barrel domain-containing protein [Acidobacteriaceae bacterium]